MKKPIQKYRKSVLNQLSNFLDKKHREVFALYLFGSFISKKSFSDIDLAVLINKEIGDPFSYESGLEYALQILIGKPIDLRILNYAPISFCYTVIKTGIVMLDKDPNQRSDFESRVIRQYLDFEYFQRRYLSEVADAPV
jgi:hypothetical protein